MKSTFTNFSRLILLTVAALLLVGATAWGQIMEENFSYSTGQLTDLSGGANVSGGNWVDFSGTGNAIQVSSSGLTYSGYAGSGIGNKIDIISTASSAEDAYRSFTTQSSGETYVAFILNLANTTGLSLNSSTTGDYFGGYAVSASTTFVNRISIRLGSVAGTYQLGIRASSAATVGWYTTDLSPGVSYLVVMSHEVVSGTTNDIGSLWVNPTIGGSEPAANATSTSGADPVDLGKFFVRQGGVTTPNASIDGIRVGTSWASAVAAPIFQYRSVTSGNWNSTSTWESSPDGSSWSAAVSTPTDADGAISVLNTHTVTVSASVSADQLTVASGGTISVSASQTLTIVNGTGTDLTVNGTLSIAGTIAGAGSISVSGSGSIVQIEEGGWGGNTNTYTYDANGTLVFNNTSGAYGVNSDFNAWPSSSGPANVTVQNTGGIDMNTSRTVSGLFQTSDGVADASSLTLNGTAQLNAGGFFTTSPVYGSGSTLVYNTGGTYGVGDEWAAGTSVGSGVPDHVTIQNSTTVNMPSSDRTVPSNLTITSGTLALNGGSGDLKVGGNWSNSGTFTSNGRAVWFNGSGAQSITNASGESFAYLIVDKSAGTLTMNNAVTVTGSAGDVLQLLNAGNLDLNGNDLNLNNDGGNILASGGARTLTGGIVNVNGTKTVTSASGGTLTIANIYLNDGMNFGSGLSDITSNLRINAGGFVDTNPPTYGGSSVLTYFSGTTYGRGTEWSATSGAGYPNHVVLNNGTTLDLGANGGAATARQMAGTLTINVATELTMNGAGNEMTAALTVLGDVVNNGTLTLSSLSGGNIHIGGSYSQASTFTPNGRTVVYDGSGTQTITAAGGMTYDGLTVNKSAGSVDLVDDITVNQTLAILDGVMNTGSKKVTLGSSGTIFEAGNGEIIVGTVEVSRTLSGTGNNTFGNVGVEMDPNASPFPGATTITRVTGTPETGAGNQSIDRSYDVSAAVNTGLDVDMVFHYDDSASELNGQDENTFDLFRSTNSGSTWTNEGGTVNTVANTMTKNNVSDLSLWSISDASNPLVTAASTTSDVVAVGSSESATISSLENDNPIAVSTDGAQVWQVTVRDGGASSPDADAFDTELIAMTLTSAGSNSVPNWSNAILQAALFDGTTLLDIGTVGASSIAFSGFSVNAPDDGSKTLTVRISLTNPLGSGVTDGQNFEFDVTDANVTAGNSSTSSQFGTFTAANSDETQNEIAVVATALDFTTQPPGSVDINTNFSAAVTAKDANGNTDLDYTSNVTMSVQTGTGTLSAASTLTHAAVSGVASWSDLQYDTGEAGVSLLASDGSITDDISNTFTVTVPTSTSSDVVAVASSEATTISSLENDSGPLTSVDGVQVWQITIRDGGGSPDVDALPTELIGLTISVGPGNTVPLWNTAINAADLFDGATQLASATVLGSSMHFTGFSASAPDNGSKTLSLRISLKNPLPAGSDGQNFAFNVLNTSVTEASPATSSQFSAFSTASSNSALNEIDVAATQLAFTTQPANNQVTNANIAPVAVSARDANGNTDLDFTGAVTLSSGTFTLASTDVGGLTQSAVSGVASWTNLSSSTTGTGTVLADATGLTQGVSSTINILVGVVTSIANGNWSDNATWDQGSPPTSAQNAVVAHTVTLTGAASVANVTVSTGDTLNLQSFALTVSGALTINAGGTVLQTGTFVDIPGPSGSQVFNATSNYTISGAATGISDIVTFGNLNWNSTANATPSQGTIIAGDLTLGGTGEFRCGTGAATSRTIVVLGNVIVNSGTLVASNSTSPITGAIDIDGDLTINASGTLRGVNFSGSGTVLIGGDLVNNGGKIRVGDGAGDTGDFIVSFKGSGAGNINPGDSSAFRTVDIASARTMTLLDTMTINSTYTMTNNGSLDCGLNIVNGAGNFTTSSGSTLGIGSPDGISAASATGNIQVTGTRTFATTANYIYNGTSAQITGDGLPASMNNLTINNSNGVSMNPDHTVNGALGLQSGILSTGAFTLQAPGTVSRTSGHVNGNLAKYIGPLSAGTSRTYEIGDATNYTPLDLWVGSIGTQGYVTASTVGTEHPNVGTANINASQSVNRYYSLNTSAVTVSDYNVTFHFVAGDVDGGADPLSFIVGKYNTPNWTYPTVGARTATSTEITGLTTFSDFAIGETGDQIITATAGTNGAISPSGAVVVGAGNDQQFLFLPDPGYHVDSVFVDGGYVDSTASYTFFNVTVPHTIHVTFALNQYTITVTQGAGGVIAPGTTGVSHGGSQAFSITPNTGYHLDSVMVDGSKVDSTTSYTFTNVTANHAITALFSINTYTLTVNTVGSGSVGKVPDQLTYDHGTNVQLTATPNLGWEFDSWSGDATGNTNPLNVTMDGNKTITATFEEDAAYLVEYRSFSPESLAVDKDEKGKIGKFIKRKPYIVDYKFVMAAPDDTMQLKLKFSMLTTGVITRGTTKTDTLATFTNVKEIITVVNVDSGDTIQIDGRGFKGKLMKTTYYWSQTSAPTKVLFKGTVASYLANIPRLRMPNRVNALFETFEQGGFAGTLGLLVGKDRTLDSAKQYGWLLSPKYTDVLKTLYVSKTATQHTGQPRGFDTWVTTKPLVKRQKSILPTKHNNALLAEMVALKFNIAASQLQKTPNGFGELVYDDGGGNPLNGMEINEIAALGDSLMMGYYAFGVHEFADSATFANLYATIDTINDAFEGTLDTIDFAAKLHFTGVRALLDVPYLQVGSSMPAKITPWDVPLVEAPVAYRLDQNYPNPFNPTTTIRFDLPQTSIVTLKIYNALGQEVATVFDNEELEDGIQEVTFDAQSIATGVYFYRLTADGLADEDEGVASQTFISVKKMVLVK